MTRTAVEPGSVGIAAGDGPKTTPVGEHEGLCERLERTFAKFAHDNHGGYGLCGGSGQVWVEDGSKSNYYRGGTCERCADNTPAPINPDGPEAATTIRTQAAELERLRGALERIRDEYRLNHTSRWARETAARALSDTPPEKNGTQNDQ